MAQFVLGDLEMFPEGRGIAIEVNGRRLAIFRLGSQVFALEDRCSHRGFPLHDGTVDESSVRCRTHGACFDLVSGAVIRGPARHAVRSFPTALVGGRIVVDL